VNATEAKALEKSDAADIPIYVAIKIVMEAIELLVSPEIKALKEITTDIGNSVKK
jgi:hypothetical protein